MTHVSNPSSVLLNRNTFIYCCEPPVEQHTNLCVVCGSLSSLLLVCGQSRFLFVAMFLSKRIRPTVSSKLGCLLSCASLPSRERARVASMTSNVSLSLFASLSRQSPTYLLLEVFIKVTNDLVTFHWEMTMMFFYEFFRVVMCPEFAD